jgi:hypothetical protein
LPPENGRKRHGVSVGTERGISKPRYERRRMYIGGGLIALILIILLLIWLF